MILSDQIARIRFRVYQILEADEPTPIATAIRVLIGILIVANVIAVYLQSHESIKSAYEALLSTFNVISVIAFTIEYVLRFWASVENPEYACKSSWKARRAYACSFMGIVDLLAIAPFYFGWLFKLDLRYLRVLRLLRVFKLIRYFRSLEVFYSVFRSQTPNLLGATLVVLLLVIMSAMMMYTAESEGECAENFDNASKAIWWAVVTLTSVGYGDVYPCTTIGKVLGGFMMLLGVGLVALPAAILAGKFADELQVRREEVTQLAAEFLEDGEMDAQEHKRLLERGQQEGFSREEVEEFMERARLSFKDSRACPKCGYIKSR